MSISYHVPLELYYYCDMENSNNDDKWLCQLMWAIGFVLFASNIHHANYKNYCKKCPCRSKDKIHVKQLNGHKKARHQINAVP